MSSEQATLKLPLFTYLVRGYLSTIVHREGDKRLLFLFRTKRKAESFRTFTGADVLIVQIHTMLSLKNFLSLPPDVDLEKTPMLEIWLDPQQNPGTPGATGAILNRTDFLQQLK